MVLFHTFIPPYLEASGSDLSLNTPIYHVVYSPDDVSEAGITVFTVALSRALSGSEVIAQISLSGEDRDQFSIEKIEGTDEWNMNTNEALRSGRHEFDVNVVVLSSSGPHGLLGSAVVDVTSEGRSKLYVCVYS